MQHRCFYLSVREAFQSIAILDNSEARSQGAIPCELFPVKVLTVSVRSPFRPPIKSEARGFDSEGKVSEPNIEIVSLNLMDLLVQDSPSSYPVPGA